MADQYSIDIRGLPELRRRADRVLDEVRPMMEDVGKFVRERAAERAKPHPADKGTLGKGIKFELEGGAVPLLGRVKPARPIQGIAWTVEAGRRPGKPPPVAALERWLTSHGIPTNPWVMQAEIRRRGTRGVKFMAGAADDARRELPRIIGSAARKIESRWGRG